MSAFNLPLRGLDEGELDNQSYVFDNNGSLTLLVSLAETGGKLTILSPETVLARRDEVVRAVNSHDRLIEALDDLAALAEHAMNLANRDGGEFNIDAELKAARAALAAARGEGE